SRIDEKMSAFPSLVIIASALHCALLISLETKTPCHQPFASLLEKYKVPPLKKISFVPSALKLTGASFVEGVESSRTNFGVSHAPSTKSLTKISSSPMFPGRFFPQKNIFELSIESTGEYSPPFSVL